MSLGGRARERGREFAIRGIHALNHRFYGYRRRLWLLGDGRSGTTWVASLLNADAFYREVFEPFHAGYVPGMEFATSHLYVPPEREHAPLEKAAAEVFSGRLWHARTDADNRAGLYRGLLVKDIFANLFARWVWLRHPELRIVLLLRHPFQVALSKQARVKWQWVSDPLTLLDQPGLRRDYLEPHRDLILRTRSREDYILNQVLIWAIINAIPLHQFAADELTVVFYEEFLDNPHAACARASGEEKVIPGYLASAPSKVTRGAITATTRGLDSWKDRLRPEVIDVGLSILADFGLDRLYADDGSPDRRALTVFGHA